MAADDISLQQFMELRFSNLEKELLQLHKMLDRLSEDAVTRDRFDQLALHVAELNRSVELIADRLMVIENMVKIYRYVGGLIIVVVMVLFIAWLRNMLKI